MKLIWKEYITPSPYHPSNRNAGSDCGGASGSLLIKLVSGDKVDGQRDLDAILLSFSHQVFDDTSPLLIVQGITDLRKQGGVNLSSRTRVKSEKFDRSLIAYKHFWL